MNLGSACTAIACPPIKRNRVPVEISARKNSFQSSFKDNVAEPRRAELLDGREALFRGRLREVFAVVRFARLERGGAEDTSNTHAWSMP